jgi:predicted MFS family arabinose efflux permease
MGMGGISSLVFGRLLDKLGLPILLLAFFLSALFAPFVFLGGFTLALIGMILWGIGLGAQDSLLKAVLADAVHAEKRSTAFGIFDTGFGIAWFLGSAAMGLLYDKSIPALIVFSVLLQLSALPVLFFAKGQERK